MYVSMTLMYLAIALATDDLWLLGLLVPLLGRIRYGVVAREERYRSGSSATRIAPTGLASVAGSDPAGRRPSRLAPGPNSRLTGAESVC